MPSDFEAAWAEAIEAGEQGCEWMKASTPAVAEWLSTIEVRPSSDGIS